MLKLTLRILAAFSAVILMLPGCAVVQTNPDANKTSPVVKELVRATQSWDGTLLPAYPQGQPEITILRISIPAGAKVHTHHHLAINAGVLISGELTVVTTDGKTLSLEAGDSIVEVVKTLHYGMNQGEVPADLIVFYVGVTGTPITVSEPY